MLQDDFYKICFDSLLEGICVTDQHGKIIMNNHALENIFGYDKGELLHKNINILIPHESRKVHQIQYNHYFSSPKQFKKGKGREFLGLHKNGHILNVEIGLNHFKYQGELFAKALITDISSRIKNELRIKEVNIELERKVEQQTKELLHTIKQLKTSNNNLKKEIREKIIAENKAKFALEKEKELHFLQTKFLSLVSHEFKTPLSGILTSVTLIEKYNKTYLNEQMERHIHSIKKLVFQLNAVLDDFLFLEKAESNKLNSRLTKFHLSELINEIIIKSDSVLKMGQKIEFKTDTEDMEVILDRTMVEIILRNVLYNAIKYSARNTKIKIDLSIKKDITVRIKDQGIGIPVEDQKHVFDRFFRAKNALHLQGTGIGLNIVKHHVKVMHGSISFKSKENEGTVFKIKLPLRIA